jgi:hypothetical protein
MKITKSLYLISLISGIVMLLTTIILGYGPELFPDFKEMLGFSWDESTSFLAKVLGGISILAFVAALMLRRAYLNEKQEGEMLEDIETFGEENPPENFTQILLEPPMPLSPEELKQFVGKRTISVEYVLVNRLPNEDDYGSYHYCDKAIMIQFDDDSRLSWLWEEPGRMSLYSGNLNEYVFDEWTTIWNASESEGWSRIIVAGKLQAIHPFYETKNDKKLLARLRLRFEDTSEVSIFSIGEPNFSKKTQFPDLAFDTTWIAVTFA